MWLRDSANQLQSYKSIIKDSAYNDTDNKIAKLFRGAINLQSRYIRQDPYCNAFHAPSEASAKHTTRAIAARDQVTPPYDPKIVFECKYELDSLAAFLQLSWDYYEETKDGDFFAKFAWPETVKTILNVTKGMTVGTYAADGKVNASPYTWLRSSTAATETVVNRGTGAPVKGGIGLVRSFFRPSDDSCIYQYFIPANMMLARYLQSCAKIMTKIDPKVADEMENMAADVVIGINKHAIVQHPVYGDLYAYEIDGFGSFNLMVSRPFTTSCHD